MIQLSTLKKSGLTLAIMLITLISRAQVSGTVTVPSVSYPDLATLISVLNTQGVSGAVTVNLNGSQVAPAGGYQLGSATLNASVSPTNTITFNGNGNVIIAPAGTITLSTSLATNNALHDDIFSVAGTDYVTFNNITFTEPNSNNNPTLAMEAALAFYNLNSTGNADGCQNITVNNCTFNMTKFGQAGAAIIALPMLFNSSTTSTWTLMSDRHRDFNITNNNFASVYSGFFIRGLASNTVRNVNFLNNTITNMGGLGVAATNSVTSYGFYPNFVDSAKMNGNNISLSNVHVTTAYAAFNGGTFFTSTGSLGGYIEAQNNTITMQTGTKTSLTAGIYFTGMVGGNMNFTGNTILFGNSPNITSGIFYPLIFTYVGGGTNVRMNLSNNSCTNQTIPGNGTKYLIYGSHSAFAPGSMITAANNSIAGNTFTGTGTVWGLFAGNAQIDSVFNNTFSNNTWSYTHATTGSSLSISTIYGIYPADGSCLSNNVYDNTVNNNIVNNSTSSTATFAGIYKTGTAGVGIKYFNNTVTNISILGTSASTATAASNVIHGIYFSGSSSQFEYFNNTIRNLTLGANSSNASFGGTINGIFILSGSGKVYNNMVNNLSAFKVGVVNGIFTQTVGTLDVYNNFITDMFAPNATNAANAINGINILSGTTLNVSHNTIDFGSATTTSTNTASFGMSGINWVGGALNLRNNIINVQGIATGTGTIVAVRRSTIGTAGVKPTGFQANNNIYYVNPGANNFLYAEGTSNAPNLLRNAYGISGNTANTTNNIVNDAAFGTSCGIYTTAFMGSSDDDAYVENNLVAGTAPGTYVPSGASFAESAGLPVAGITTDYANVTRSAIPDMGALQFAGTGTDIAAPAITLNAIPTLACTTIPVQNVVITDNAGVNVTTNKPRLYYKKSGDANTFVGNTAADNGWKFVEATNASSPFAFSLNPSILQAPIVAGDVIQYFVVAQDNNSTANVAVNGAVLAAGFCPSSVNLPLAAFPATNVNSFRITPPSGVIVSSSPNPVCEYTATVLTAGLSVLSQLPTGYGISSATTIFDEDIINVSLGTGGSLLNNSSTCSTTGGAAGNGLPASVLNRYSNYTTTGLTIPTLTNGQTVPFSVQIGTCGTINYPNGLKIFIDYNRNGSFTDPGEEVYVSPTTTSGPHFETGSFTVPSFAQLGYALMRVINVETFGSISTVLPTGTYSYGETEDYIVNLQGGNPADVSQPVVPASVAWQVGTTVVGTTNPLSIVPTASTNYVAYATDANGCTFVGATSVSMLPAPAAPSATNSLQCGTQIPTASVASLAGTNGTGYYNWFSASTGGTNLQSGGGITSPLIDFYNNNFSSITNLGNATLSGAATVVSNQLQITPNAGSQQGGITIAPGVNTARYKVDFDVTTSGTAGNMADGFSYSFGDDVNASATSPSQEKGSGTKLKISFDSYDASGGTNGQGIYLMYNNTMTSITSSPLSAGVLGYSTNVSWVGTANNHVTIDIQNGLLTLTLNGTAIFNNIALPSAFVSADKSTWRHVIAGRTGGSSMQTLIDNLIIQIPTGNTTFLNPISNTTTFFVSEVGTNGCSSLRTPVTATVNVPDLLTASASNTVNVCVNTPITLSVAKTGTANTYAYAWNATPATGSGLSVSGSVAPANGSLTVTPTAAGTYIYTISGFDGTVTPNCATSANVTVNVVDPWNGFVASINPNNAAVCNGSSVNLTSVLNGPQTLPTGYGASNAIVAADEDIINVSLGTGGSLLNNSSTCFTTGGGAGNGLPASVLSLYSNYTTTGLPIPTLTIGQTVPFSVQIATCGTFNYNNATKIYIDLNRNGSFADPGEQVYVSAAVSNGPNFQTGNFNIPNTAIAGRTLMRVVNVETSSPASINPTGTYGYGETEDYIVNITSNPASLTWNEGTTALGTTPVLSYTSPVIGPHTINFTASSAIGGCALTSSDAIVTVNAIPSAPSISNSVQCGTKVPSNLATSTAGALGSGTFNWYTAPAGGTPVETTTSGLMQNYQVGTTTTLYVSEMSVAGCESARTPFLITVNPIDAVIATASATVNVCANTPVSLNVTKVGTTNIYTYNWTATPQVNSGLPSGGTATSLNAPIIATPTAAGTYEYKITATEVGTGCAVTDTVNVTVVDPWNGYTAVIAPTTSSFCDGNSTILTANVLGPQNVPTGYLPSSASSTADDEILNVSLGNNGSLLNNTSSCATTGGIAGNGLPASILNRYSNYTTVTSLPTPVLNIGTTIPWSLTLGYCSGNAYSAGYSIFIDYNRNGSFTDPGEKVAGSTVTDLYAVTGSTVSGTLTVPSTALVGKTLMRVVMIEFSATPTSTGTYTWGETEDYLVDLVSASATSYVWKEGATTLGNTNTLTYTGSVGPHNINVTAASAQGCLISSQNALVTVLPLPSAPTAANSAHCGSRVPTASVTKTSGANGNGTFKWYTSATGNTTAQVGTSTTFTSIVATTTTFFVSEVGVNGCESARTPVTITVTPADPITATASNPNNLCINTPLDLSVAQTGSNNTYVFTWRANPQVGSGIGVAGIVGTATTPTTVTPTASGVITYTVTGIQNGPAVYSNLIAGSIFDEDCGNVTITQGATTILNNTTPINSLVGTIGTATGIASRRSDFSAFGPYTLNANGTYNLSITTINQGTNYNHGIRAYIDYNRNGSFADAGETIYTSPALLGPPRTETTTFTVPSTAINGLTKMRIIVNEGPTPTPESAPFYGEVEEYAINLVTPNSGGGDPSTGCLVFNSVNVNVINPWAGITPSITPSTANICGLGTPVSLTGSAGGPNTMPTGYCATTNSGSACITNVSFATLSNPSSCASASPYYTNYTTSVLPANVAPGQTYNFTISSDLAITSVWFDWNRNGVFENSEWYQPYTSGTSATIPITVPLTAQAGMSRFRVRSRLSFNTNGAGDACTFMGSGETEDYAMMIGATPASHTWTEATTTLGTNATLAYIPTSFGTKTITYTAADANGCKISANATLNVSQPAAPVVANLSLCQNSTATALTATALAGHTVNWYISETGGTALSSAPIPSTTTVGTTTYYATQTTPQGCESLRTPLVVTVIPAPAFTSANTIAAVCNQTAITYTPTSSVSGATFAWSRATVSGIATAASTGTGAINENLNNTTVNPVMVTYVYTTTNPANGCTSTNNVTVNVNPAATLSSATTAPAVCSNNSFTYTPTSATAGTTFAWSRAAVTGISNAAGTGTGIINENLVNTTASPVTVTYNYVLTANGCSNTQSITVVVNPSATMSSALTASVCSERSFKYTPLSATTGTSFAWSRAAVSGITNAAATGTGAINETLINTTQAAINVTYVYTLTANGCTNTQNLVVTVNPTPAKLVITADGPTVFCKEESVVLRFNPLNTGTYQWYQDGVPVSGATATNTRVTTAGSYTAIVTNSFGCASDPSTAMVVEVPCEIGISLPDIFTPNGDGSNDKIKPIVPGIHTFSFFRVYNRWGNLVFESTDPNAAWDGSYKGEMQPQDSYSYVIEGYNFRMELIRKQGTITLVR